MTFEYTIEAHPTTYRNTRFRSRLEATWAAFFDKLEWRWDYEPFDLKGWSPDFRLKGKLRDVLVEVKPLDGHGFDQDVAYKIMDAANGKFDLLICGLTPVRHDEPQFYEHLVSLQSCCCCDGHNCWWMARSIVKLKDGRFDLVFRHGPFVGFSTGMDADYGNSSPWQGQEVMALWAKAKNLVQYLR